MSISGGDGSCWISLRSAEQGLESGEEELLALSPGVLGER